MSDHHPNDSNIDPDADTLETAPEESSGRTPRKIGQYRIIRVIGSGGMGTVYEGIQENPNRKVAIKVMRSGVTSRSAMRRFEYESQVLGRLSHPAIAKVFEAGTWDDGTGGVPYFAMEYITGANGLLDYAKKKDLHTTAKLELFTEVCDAVHHGHLKGVIHRDLKPDNILVDHAGNPKIIDFGVARATDSDIAVTTLQTNVGQLVGTVQYMSPEQCEADPDLIDARSDVYSMGVILFELLTGQPPYDLSSIPIYEATRLIREQQPTRMTTIADGIAGDLETIVSKAMDKDCDRRYQSASELLQDIHRFIENEPIHARRASMVYQLKLFAKRNRGMVATVLAIGIALVLATIVSVFSSIRASEAEQAAIVDLDRAVAAEEKVAKKHQELLDAQIILEEQRKAALIMATAGQEMAETIKSQMQKLAKTTRAAGAAASFNSELLSLGVPRNAMGKEFSVRDILINATEIISERFNEEPTVELIVSASIGELLLELGELDLAKVQLERALELHEIIDDEVISRSYWGAKIIYAKILLDLGDYGGAREVAMEIIEGATVDYGENSTTVLKAKDVLGDIMNMTMENPVRSLQLRREILDAIAGGRKVSREFELSAQVSLGSSLLVHYGLTGSTVPTEELMEAKKILSTVLTEATEELGAQHPVTVEANRFQSMVFQHSGQHNEALEMAKEVLEDSLVVFGPNHIETADAYGWLGFLRFLRGSHEESSELLGKAIAIYDRSIGKDSYNALSSQIWLANSLTNLGEANSAEVILRASIPLLEAQVGVNHPTVVNAKASLAVSLLTQGKFELGDTLWHEVTDAMRTLPSGDDGQPVLNMRFVRAVNYVDHGLSEADEIVDSLLSDAARIFGPNNIQTIGWAFHLGLRYTESGRFERGLSLVKYWLEQANKVSESEDPQLLMIELELAKGYLDHDMSLESLQVLDRIVTPINSILGEEHQIAVFANILRTRSMILQDRASEATEILLDLRDHLTTKLGAEDSVTLNAEVALAKSFISQKRWNDLDALMTERVNRRHDNPELLIDMVDVIVRNGDEEYKQRYLQLALTAAQRAVEILGQNEPDAIFALANVYLARGEQEEALNWLAKTVAFAGEDHENIDAYRSRLEEASSQMKEPVQQ